jgi:sterol desaturase/sphingolipid hydroxylase (fatty acid hydroxylase superfamily)
MRWLAIKPLLSIDLAWMVQSDNPLYWLLGYTVVPFAGLFIFDLFYYCFHRAQHTITVLWRLHSTHHSIEELNAFNCYHHIFEQLLRVPLIAIPMAVLVSVSVPQVAVTVFLLSITAILSMPTRNYELARYGIFWQSPGITASITRLSANTGTRITRHFSQSGMLSSAPFIFRARMNTLAPV